MVMHSEEAAFAARLAELAGRIPPDVVEEIRAAHDGYGFMCNAASEGLECCLSWLAGVGDDDDGLR